MSWEIIFLLVVVVAIIALSILEVFRIDIIAMLAMLSLLLTGIINTDQALAGFANEATITVAAMFVLSAGLLNSGILDRIGQALSAMFTKSFYGGMISMMLLSGVISAFINNTAVVAIFTPLILQSAAKKDLPASRLLMPLSFASMLGGVCSLVGTSTNILVSSIADNKGLDPFAFFEFTPVGSLLFIIGFAYIIFLGIRLIPARTGKDEDLTSQFGMGEYLADLEVLEKGADSSLEEIIDPDSDNIELVTIFRGDKAIQPSSSMKLKENDLLRIRASIHDVLELQKEKSLKLLPRSSRMRDSDLEEMDHSVVEAVIAPNSTLAEQKLKNCHVIDNYSSQILAVGQKGRITHKDLLQTRVGPGDTLLMRIPRNRMSQLQNDDNFVVTSSVKIPERKPAKMILSAVIIVGVVGSAAAGLVPIVASALAGSVMMVLTGCVKAGKVYQSIEWKVIILLGAILSVGAALEETGGAELIAGGLKAAQDTIGNYGLVAGLFGVTFMLTNVISNNATAALLAPIAISLADQIGVDARPFLVAVTMGASLSFMTPIGYQTNTFIYGPGRYKFKDFMIVGAPLNLLLWPAATFLIPWFWPF